MLTSLLTRKLDDLLRAELEKSEEYSRIDFRQPAGEESLAPPDSVSWRVFRNPVSLLIGGIAAVLMELAEPRVRSGVWDHTTFRTDPLRRMRRTGLAAMVTVYGARSVAEDMIAGVARMHARIEGTTPAGTPYRADDPELLRWVHATALYGFMEAFSRFVTPLASAEKDRFVAEGIPAALLYGATDPPASEGDLTALIEGMLPKLESSDIIGEFLQIMRQVRLFPAPFGSLNGAVLCAAIDLLPPAVRQTLDLGDQFALARKDALLLSQLGQRINRLPLPSSPATQACLRLGLPADYLCSP